MNGAAIGCIGGGQLGRMLAMAARRMGYRIHIFEPTPDCPACQVGDEHCKAAFDDAAQARAFAEAVDVITFEFENIPADTLAAVEAIRPTHPAPRVLDICRHRRKEKTFLHEAGLTVAPFRVVHHAEELAQAVEQLGCPCVVKTAEFGYDGKGQVKIESPDQVDEAWQSLGTREAVLEAFVPFEKEVSVVAARGVDGQVVTYAVCENDHANHILDVTTVPANVSNATAEAALQLGRDVLNALEVVGVLTTEMFVVPADFGHGIDTGDGHRLIINELAPRPHNSGHFSVDACVTSQFEQQLRAVCGLPLGDPAMRQPRAAMANLLGDLWYDAEGNYREPDWLRILALPDVKLHLYGKHEARPGRKMGHLNATAATPGEAREKVLHARAMLQN